MIEEWLGSLQNIWLAKDIDKLSDIFTKDVEYWENPFRKLRGIHEVKQEWSAINEQDEIDLHFNVLDDKGKYCVVLWTLRYTKKGIESRWAGVYLVKLNPDGKCKYFFQAGEKV